MYNTYEIFTSKTSRKCSILTQLCIILSSYYYPHPYIGKMCSDLKPHFYSHYSLFTLPKFELNLQLNVDKFHNNNTMHIYYIKMSKLYLKIFIDLTLAFEEFHYFPFFFFFEKRDFNLVIYTVCFK